MPARFIRNSLRLTNIALILAREDALFFLVDLGAPTPIIWLGKCFRRKSTLPPGKRLARALEKLGPTFIKLGQTLSTRSDLVGEDIALELADLRDNLPPFKMEIARAIIEVELGAPVTTIFKSFSEPLAAASIAQVHKAELHNGKQVAVKILRPNIHAAFARDMELFFWLAQIIEHRLPRMRRLKPLEVVRTFQEAVAFELDLRFEAAAATELAKNTANDTGFRVPQVDWNLTSERVLVLEWVNGIPLNDVSAIVAQGHNLDIILSNASEMFFKQVFRDGYFHADLHPGNLFIDEQGDIVAVDFGIMGRLDWKSRLYVAEILRGFLNEDYRHVAEVHFRAGYVPSNKSIDNFTLACMAIAKPILDKPLHEISVGKLLGQLFKITETFEMETQPQLLLLQKTMVMVEGVGRMLNPSINMWEMARAPIEDWAKEHFSPIGKMREVKREAESMIFKLPNMLRQIESAFARISDPAGIKIHVDSLNALYALEKRKQQQWMMLAWMVVITGLAALLIMSS